MPFDKLDELLVPDVVEKVPEQYRYLACALHWRQYYWSDEDGIRKDMELEAYRSATIDTFLAMVKANRYLIEKYLSGELYKDDEERRVAERGCRREAGLHFDSDSDVEALAANDAAGEEMRLNCKQRQLKNCASARMEDSVKAHLTQSDREYAELAEAARARGRIIAGLGPPGTGKTTVAMLCLQRCLRLGGRALLACPTAQQAARMRAKLSSEVDIDTCSGAFFLYKPAQEVMAMLSQYDLVVVDEVSQLSDEDFERIVQMWEASERLPCLCFLGDFWQLPGMAPRRACDSPKWRQHVQEINFWEEWRCKCPHLSAKLRALRTAQPTKLMLNKILRGHRAWWGHDTPTAWD
ncbi:MAG: AAA family ATPase, partial [bacterium]|nr:AAA family ATPase [bacterium]